MNKFIIHRSPTKMRRKLYYIPLVIILFLFQYSAFGQGVVSDTLEKQALVAFYNSTNQWTGKWTLTSINLYPNIPADSLKGVIIENGDISSINISPINLQGTLPAEFNNLTELKTLSITRSIYSGVTFTGQFPDLRGLTKLKTLNLNSHDFTGEFPSWIGSLISLESLYLSSYPNSISFSGVIPASISQLTNLKQLSLNNNNFSAVGSIPNTLSDLDLLQTLDLHSCSLNPQSIDSGLSGLNSVISINLGGNSALVMPDGTFPDKLLNLPNLTTLILSSNGFTYFPESITLLSKLNYLDLSSTNYSDTSRLGHVIDRLKECPALKTLLLTSCNLQGLPLDFNQLEIETLYLSNNSSLDPSRCDVLGELPTLKNLYVYYCNLTTLPVGLALSNSLTSLYASYNQLYPVPSVIKEISNLQTLHLTQNGILGLPEWFGTDKMDTLSTLVLDNNELVTLPENFSLLKNLTHISIANNNLNGSWPADFEVLTNVKSLNLSNNEIVILPDLSSWTALNQVYLQNNKLSGTVPLFLTNSTSLKTAVNISYNDYKDIDPESHFNGTSPSIVVNSNQFTFNDVLEFRPASGVYTYSPQDSVDTKKELFVYAGGSVTLVAAIDTALAVFGKCRYQWFKYVNGINDIALSSAPSETANKFTLTNVSLSFDRSFVYYKITHPNAPNLTLISRPQTIIISCKGAVTKADFNAKRYLCAMNFKPDLEYITNCNTITYNWNFGDGTTSSEKNAWHAYNNEGTYNVTLRYNFVCGDCVGDSTVTKQVYFSLPEQLIVDSLVSVPTEVKTEVLSVSAGTFSESWPLSISDNVANLNSYKNGQQGVWRNDGSYVYDTVRSFSTKSNLKKDGTFTLEHFNWGMAGAEAIPNWIKANAVTRYSPYSYELENKDVLGVYSSALYDYGGHLPSANGVNMRNDEMGFTSFEYLDGNITGNFLFGNQPLPDYYIYKVKSANNHIAVVEATIEQLTNVKKVDVSGKGLLLSLFSIKSSNYIQDNEIICMERHPENPSLSLIVLKRALFSGLWIGEIKVKNNVEPTISPVIDNSFSHTGKSSLKISSETIFKQDIFKLDSAKSYFINGWVSVNNLHLTTPTLGGNLGVEVIFKNTADSIVRSQVIEPSGPIIEGWQQLRGTVICPDDRTKVEMKFKPGSSGTSWYDDLRIHPEKGNMKTYVYDLKDYKLQAILDEENFATLYYYDAEGKLQLVKKETEKGIKTISENVSHQVENQ